MFKNKIFLGLFIIALIGIVYYSLNTSASYPEEITKARQEYSDNLLNATESPIKDKNAFSGFKYFEPDEKYKVSAQFISSKDSETSLMLMTDSSNTSMKKAGVANFELDGKSYQLSLFDEDDIYLLAFKDLTSGKETYGGGRYINIPKKDLVDGKMMIDFNKAHNFYCAYSEDFVCPVPPKENALPIAILAGEKKYKE